MFERRLTLLLIEYILTTKNAEFDSFSENELYFILGNQEIVTAKMSTEELQDVLTTIIRW